MNRIKVYKYIYIYIGYTSNTISATYTRDTYKYVYY